MKYELIQNSNKAIIGIDINTEVEFLQDYNSTSFIISFNGVFIDFLTEVLSPTKIRLNFIEESFLPYYILECNLTTIDNINKKFVNVLNVESTGSSSTSGTISGNFYEGTIPSINLINLSGGSITTPASISVVNPEKKVDFDIKTKDIGINTNDYKIEILDTKIKEQELKVELKNISILSITPATDDDGVIKTTPYELKLEVEKIGIFLIDIKTAAPVKLINKDDTNAGSVDTQYDCAVSINSSGFKIISNSFSDLNKQTVTLEKYILENYSDFPIEVYDVINDPSQIYYFDFEPNYVYSINIQYENFSTSFGYIHDRPNIYYSSLYHLSKLSEKYALKIKNSDEEKFDMKLLIWRESKAALEVAGVPVDRIDIIDNESSVINKYVTMKVLAYILARNLIDSSIQNSLDDIEDASSSSGKIQLGEFVTEAKSSSSSGSSGSLTDTINAAFKSINAEIVTVEDTLKKIYIHLLSEKKVKINNERTFKRSKLMR